MSGHLGAIMSKAQLGLGILTISLMSVCQVGAADLTVRGNGPRLAVAQTQVECIQWVRQNQSWYNYCDPVPYFPRTTYGDSWWDPRWATRPVVRY
jgi:hypothetical protein